MATSDKKQDKITNAIARGILLLAGIVFVVALFLKNPCNGIDDEFLSCKIQWTWGDILGVPLFLFGVVWISGIWKGISGLYTPAGSTVWNYVWFAGMLLGILLFMVF